MIVFENTILWLIDGNQLQMSKNKGVEQIKTKRIKKVIKKEVREKEENVKDFFDGEKFKSKKNESGYSEVLTKKKKDKGKKEPKKMLKKEKISDFEKKTEAKCFDGYEEVGIKTKKNEEKSKEDRELKQELKVGGSGYEDVGSLDENDCKIKIKEDKKLDVVERNGYEELGDKNILPKVKKEIKKPIKKKRKKLKKEENNKREGELVENQNGNEIKEDKQKLKEDLYNNKDVLKRKQQNMEKH